MNSTQTPVTPAAVAAAIAKLTKQGRHVVEAIGAGISFFDDGIVEGSGSWGSTLAGDTGVEAGVLTGLRKQGILDSSPAGDEDAGEWWTLTALGAAVVNQLLAAPVVETAAPSAPRGSKKTGDPKADRAIAAAKVAKAEAAAHDEHNAKAEAEAKAARAARRPALSAEAKAEAVAKKIAARDAANARSAARKAERVLPAIPSGYALKYDNGAYLLAKNVEGAKSATAAWKVICTAHGTTTDAAAAKLGDALGRKAGRAGWCTGCKTA